MVKSRLGCFLQPNCRTESAFGGRSVSIDTRAAFFIARLA